MPAEAMIQASISTVSENTGAKKKKKKKKRNKAVEEQ